MSQMQVRPLDGDQSAIQREAALKSDRAASRQRGLRGAFMTSQSIAGGEPAGALKDVRAWAALILVAAAWFTGPVRREGLGRARRAVPHT